MELTALTVDFEDEPEKPLEEFSVLVEETLAKVIRLKATDAKDAIDKVSEKYDKGLIKLDYGDYDGDAQITLYEN